MRTPSRRSGRSAASLAVLGVVALTGCPEPREYTDGNALVLATYSDFNDQAAALTEGWRTAHPGVDVSLMPLQARDFDQAIYPRLLTGAHVPDVLFVDAGFLARYGRGTLVADLGAPAYAASPLLAELPPSAIAQATTGGRLAGVPADLAPMALFYRTDVLEKAGVAAADLSGSLEAFVEACARVRAAAGASCLATESELFEWALRAGLPSGASPFVSPAGEPFPDGVRVGRAFELARRAAQAGIASHLAVGAPDWRNALRQGRIAALAGGPALLRRLEALAPKTRGLWRAAPLPGGATLSAPSMYCMLSEKGARKELAWQLVRGACLSKEAQLVAFERTGALPALRAAAADPRVDAPRPFLGGQVIGPDWRTAAGALPVVRFERTDPAAAEALARELDPVLHEGKPVDQALADARAAFGRWLAREAKRER